MYFLRSAICRAVSEDVSARNPAGIWRGKESNDRRNLRCLTDPAEWRGILKERPRSIRRGVHHAGAVAPGMTVLTVTPLCPSSFAQLSVKLLIATLVAE